MSTSTEVAGGNVPASDTRKVSRIRETPEVVLIPLVFVVVLLAWEIGLYLGDVADYVLPRPSVIGAEFLEMVRTSMFWSNFRVTATEVLVGFGLGIAAAVVLGSVISQFRVVEKTLMPYIVAIQTVPKIAIAPLLIIWFGFGIGSKVLIAALVCFFPMLINIIEGLKSANPEQVDMLRSVGASRFQIFRMVAVPSSLPFAFAGLDIGIVFAILGALVGEFVGAEAGLGYLLLQFNYRFNVAGVFAVLIVLSMMGHRPPCDHGTAATIHLLERRGDTPWGLNCESLRNGDHRCERPLNVSVDEADRDSRPLPDGDRRRGSSGQYGDHGSPSVRGEGR